MTDRKNLADWAQAVWDNAEAHGFHDAGVNVSSYVANLHGEVSELWKNYHNKTLDDPCGKKIPAHDIYGSELSRVAESLADILIRTMDTAVQLGVDPERAVTLKHGYNLTRSFRHGGKKS